MKKKIKIITDFETKILSNYLESFLNKKKNNFLIDNEQLSNLNIAKIPKRYDYILYLSQLEKALLQFKLFCDTGKYNEKKLNNEVENISKIIKKFSLENKKIIFFLWPNDTKDIYFGGINHKANGKSWLINYINLKISKLLSKYNNVSIIDPNFEILRENKKINFFDYKLKYLIDCYYSQEYLSFVSNVFVKKIKSENLSKIKIIIVDLDNTMWGGLAGELSYDKLKIGPNSIEGQVFLDFQKRLKLLKSMGIVLAISSKNELSNVKKVFKKNKYMFLSLSDFSSVKVNWEPKAKNIDAILKELNLKAHHALFIDDSPFERSSVKNHIKNINIFNFPSNLLDLMDNFNNYSGFYKNFITELDKKRTTLYQAEAKRESEKNKFKNDSKWLKNLKIRLTIKNIKDMERATEMFQRTNQFNTSFRRLSAPELIKINKSRTNLILEASMKDKFGDYGIISIINIKIFKQYFIIEDFLMSCRVFKREIELAILNFILNLKILNKKLGFININRVEKNLYVQNLFDSNNLIKNLNKKKYEINNKIKFLNLKRLGINIIK
tara:strand:- start:79 stop:1737 length:1659 start_codon:yes stop_codon:yes gene_type:complete